MGSIGADYFLVKSKQFYADNAAKPRGQDLVFSGRKLPLSQPIGMKPAFSDDGKSMAFATSESGKNDLPIVKVCPTDAGSQIKLLELDFSIQRDKLEPGWKISGISFDSEQNRSSWHL